MPKKVLPKLDTPDGEGPSEASGHSKDASGTVTSTDNIVLGAIAALRSELAGVKVEICDKIENKISEVTAVLRGEIASLKAENDKAITTLRNEIESHGHTLQELANTASGSSDAIRELENKVETLRGQVTSLSEKCLDLEGRSKRQNLRVVGVKEGKEDGQNAREFAGRLLKEALGLDETPVIDRAHRALRKKPGDNEPPRHLIVRVHYCHTYEDIMKKVMGTRDITFCGWRIQIFQDLPPEVAKRRATFTAVRRMLRDKPGVKYGLLYPAKLRVSHDGVENFFTDLEKARQYAERLIGDVDNGGSLDPIPREIRADNATIHHPECEEPLRR